MADGEAGSVDAWVVVSPGASDAVLAGRFGAAMTGAATLGGVASGAGGGAEANSVGAAGGASGIGGMTRADGGVGVSATDGGTLGVSAGRLPEEDVTGDCGARAIARMTFRTESR